MLEDEVLSLLLKAKELYKTNEAAPEVLGVSRSTFFYWTKEGKGVRELPLLKALDILGAHLVVNNERPKTEEKTDCSLSCQNSIHSMDALKTDILKTKNEGLEREIGALTAHNATLQEQLRLVSSLLQESLKKKESPDSTLSGSISKIS